MKIKAESAFVIVHLKPLGSGLRFTIVDRHASASKVNSCTFFGQDMREHSTIRSATEKDIDMIVLNYVKGNLEAEAVWSRLGFHSVLTTATTKRSEVGV